MAGVGQVGGDLLVRFTLLRHRYDRLFDFAEIAELFEPPNGDGDSQLADASATPDDSHANLIVVPFQNDLLNQAS